MQTICFDFPPPPPADDLPRLWRNHGTDADTMLAQAQLLSCLASEKNRHSGGCALPCIPCVPRRGQPGPEYTRSKYHKGKTLPGYKQQVCVHSPLVFRAQAYSQLRCNRFHVLRHISFKQFSNSLRAISRLEKFRLLLFNTELQQISPADMS